MTLATYHARDYAVQPHPQGKYYRVADVDPMLAQLEAVLTRYACRPKEMQSLMRAHGLKIDDLNNPMQQLAFMLYTEIVRIATEARVLLAQLKETP